MCVIDKSDIDKIANICVSHYNNLPKTGKPIENEWTVLSCFIEQNTSNASFEIVSLGTGSKCIGASKLSPLGDILNDSHAEIMARRGFLVYLLHHINLALERNESSIFLRKDEKLCLKKEIKFIFYSSQLPCGDASIIPKIGDETNFGEELICHKRKAEKDFCKIDSKILKGHDIHRTGAKCLPGDEQDPKADGADYHLFGKVRTKPGRGDRTLSVSCSDKMARWVHLGVQGSLLDMLLSKPIRINHFIFGSGVPFCKETLERALLHRDAKILLNNQDIPKFYQSSISFPGIRNETKLRPAPGSIVWIKMNKPILETAVLGKKLGVTKKEFKKLCSSMCISKYNLYKKFLAILSKDHSLKLSILQEEECIENIPYNVMKQKNVKYIKKWSQLKIEFFKSWTVKPDMWNFCVSSLK